MLSVRSNNPRTIYNGDTLVNRRFISWFTIFPYFPASLAKRIIPLRPITRTRVNRYVPVVITMQSSIDKEDPISRCSFLARQNLLSHFGGLYISLRELHERVQLPELIFYILNSLDACWRHVTRAIKLLLA